MASDAIPKTMKAWIVTSNGPPATALTLNPDWPAPTTPTGANIVVKISHAALNPADLHFMANLPKWLPFRRNAIPGLDFAGAVVAAGPAVPKDSGIVAGTAVCGSLPAINVAVGKGSCAEYVMVAADSVAVVPKSLAGNGAAAAGLMGVAGQTAFIVMRAANVKEGYRVLVNGASGGVGSVLVQAAKAKGATVVAVCSGANEAMVKRLGADEVIDYKVHSPLHSFVAAEHQKDPFDLIFDTIGDQALFNQSPQYLKKEGIFISIAGGRSQGVAPFVRNKLIPTFLGGTPRAYQILGLAPCGAFAREAAKWAEDKAVKEMPIDSEYPMDQLVNAYEKLATKRAKGKIILKVSQ